jgi:hypothetical protein
MLAATFGTPAAALADGDPASDVLLLRDIYLPYAPPPAPGPAKALQALLAQLRKEHYPIKVALIETRGDLGAYPELYGKAPQYAKLLEQEIAFKAKKPRMVIVMQGAPPAGRNLGPKGDAILATIRPDPAAKSDGLVKAATEAVSKLAAAGGHPVTVPKTKATKAHGTSHTALYIVAALVVLAGIGLIAVSVRRPRGT